MNWRNWKSILELLHFDWSPLIVRMYLIPWAHFKTKVDTDILGVFITASPPSRPTVLLNSRKEINYQGLLRMNVDRDTNTVDGQPYITFSLSMTCFKMLPNPPPVSPPLSSNKLYILCHYLTLYTILKGFIYHLKDVICLFLTKCKNMSLQSGTSVETPRLPFISSSCPEWFLVKVYVRPSFYQKHKWFLLTLNINR